MKVSRESPLPCHFQLREAIKRDALRNGLKAGDAIPSERELAQAHGVSRATVRRAVSDLVSEGFLRKEARRGVYVADAARARPWLPNDEKRALGAMICGPAETSVCRMLRGIDDECYEADYSVVFANAAGDPARAARQLARMADQGAAGFVVAPLAGEDYLETNERLLDAIRAMGPPFVLLDSYIEGAEADTVVSDSFDAAYRAAQHLVDKGHRRIAFLAHQASSAAQDQLSGYRKCLRDNGICPDKDLARWVQADRVKPTVRELLNTAPATTAMMFGSDAMAVLAWEAIGEMGLRVPEDVALVGFGNMANSDGPGSRITTTNQPCYEEGRTACRMLIDRLEGYRGEPRFAVLESSLIEGYSTAAEVARKVCVEEDSTEAMELDDEPALEPQFMPGSRVWSGRASGRSHGATRMRRSLRMAGIDAA